MKRKLKNFIREGKSNKLFIEQMNEADNEFFIPSWFSNNTDNAIFGCLYEGWLVARGEFDESKYK